MEEDQFGLEFTGLRQRRLECCFIDCHFGGEQNCLWLNPTGLDCINRHEIPPYGSRRLHVQAVITVPPSDLKNRTFLIPSIATRREDRASVEHMQKRETRVSSPEECEPGSDAHSLRCQVR